MKPTIGRIVHYTLSEGDVALIDQNLPAYAGQGVQRNSVKAGDVYPAVVVRVFDPSTTTANLQVLLDGNCSYWATSRTEGEGESHWSWPPRV
ncbi:hypothetical protein [Nonomuraea sp. 10N515B]|uniref:hypothetical protein n=1 Tax=Nonomuraea sp. 10N515B TaxID=3457422 RepID=UPI003FCD493C